MTLMRDAQGHHDSPIKNYASIKSTKEPVEKKNQAQRSPSLDPHKRKQRHSPTKANQRRGKSFRILPKKDPKRLSSDHRTILKLFLTLCFIFFAIFFFQRFFMLWSYHHSSIPNEVAIQLIDEIPSIPSLAESLEMHVTYRLAGSPQALAAAKQTKKLWQQSIRHVDIASTDMLLNTPRFQQVLVNGQLIRQHQAPAKDTQFPFAFHALSADGNVTGPVIFVGDGLEEDYVSLAEHGYNVTGSIALIRHQTMQGMAGHQVMLAQRHGCIGSLMFADPDLPNKQHEQHADVPSRPYPDGPWRPATEAAFASVSDLANGIHVPWSPPHVLAPTTRSSSSTDQPADSPFYASIPSIPLSWQEGQAILNLTASGQLVLGQMTNVNHYAARPIHNIVGRIPGQLDPDKFILLGCQRDAWTDAGVIDSASASATMDELVRTLGVLLKKGWRPRRTVVLASWDASDYGHLGSAGWVDEHKEWLYKNAVAHIDVGSSAGEFFQAQGSPLLQRLLHLLCQDVFDPVQGQSLFDLWKKHRVLRGQSLAVMMDPIALDNDAIPFFYQMGIPSLSLSFQSDHFGVAQSHLDNLDWMYRFGDKKLTYHRLMVKLVALLTLHLSCDPILPLYPVDYAHRLLDVTAERADLENSPWPQVVDALFHLANTSTKFDRKMTKDEDAFRIKKHFSKKLRRHAQQMNEALAQFERTFLDPMGMPGRPWYKHAMYGPSLWDPTLIEPLPSLSQPTNISDPAIEQRIAALLLTANDLLLGARKLN
ncbi:Zn-dependent exopeptidase [Hesseltinella vesiculosa]|uniref:Zn-dependent exopeptidase n=1 Tax=Hesseltinella vesiculosa TaxID=101127 RepID=A0A1X2GUZ8_9FUNG|nr:Zn-dependent exopeptidase [Hesseltinella vesiculosa]